jgi:hypothetical protein
MGDSAKVSPGEEAPTAAADGPTAADGTVSAAADSTMAAAADSTTAAAGDSNVVLDIDSDLEEMDVKLAFDVGDELDDEPNAGNGADDPERLPKEAEAYPALHALEEKEPEGRKAKVFAKFQQDAAVALKAGNLTLAVENYTEAMRVGGATPVCLAHRAHCFSSRSALVQPSEIVRQPSASIPTYCRLTAFVASPTASWAIGRSHIETCRRLRNWSGTRALQRCISLSQTNWA